MRCSLRRDLGHKDLHLMVVVTITKAISVSRGLSVLSFILWVILFQIQLGKLGQQGPLGKCHGAICLLCHKLLALVMAIT